MVTTSDTLSSDVEPSLVRLRAEIIGTANVSPTLSDNLTDIFFICGDDFYPIQCHRVILRNWSQFFAKVVDSSLTIKGPFPVAPFIVLKEVCGKDLQDIFKFIYNGEVVIERSRIGSLLRTARFLEINQLPDLLEASEELKDDLRALSLVDPVNSEKSAETVEQDKSDPDENATSSNVEKSNGLEERLTRQTQFLSSIFRLPQTIEPFKPEKSPTKPVEQIEIDLTSDQN